MRVVFDCFLDRDEALEELKIYGRDPRNADPIFTKEVSYYKYNMLFAMKLRLTSTRVSLCSYSMVSKARPVIRLELP